MKNKTQKDTEREIQSKLNKSRKEIYKLNDKVRLLDKKTINGANKLGNLLIRLAYLSHYFEEASKKIDSILKEHKKKK